MADKKKEKDYMHKVVVKIEKEEWQKALDKEFERKNKEVSIPGFRKGNAPRDMYEKKYGKESLFIGAADSLLQEAYMRAMNDNKELVPVVQPTVDLKTLNEDCVEYEFSIITSPKVEVKKYKGLKVEKEKVKVEKEEVEHEIGHLLEKYSELVVKEKGKLENGETAIIDFEGFLDGVAFDGGKGENYSLEIGSNTFIPGFEEQLIGMKVNEEKDINVKFPEDYHAENLKGKDVVFKVKLHEIKIKKTRELDKELFEDLAIEGVVDEKTLREKIEKDIKENKEKQAENNYIDNLLKEISKNTEVDIPEEMINDEVNNMIKRFEEQLKMQGINIDMYYKFTNSNEDSLREQMEKEAHEHVLYRLMMEEIMKKENIEISEKEVEEEIKKLSDTYKMKEEDIIKAFAGKEMIKYDLEMRQLINNLKEYNK